MKISIITPIYHGNQYLDRLLSNINQACSNIEDEVEMILVNDSPDIPITYDQSNVTNFQIIELDNPKNIGIHQSRISGLRAASGKYIIFLDQDDQISENCISSQLQIAKTTPCDIVLGNGYIEDKHCHKQQIFNNAFSLTFATSERPYLLARDFIISPGQCLIKKTSIPTEWTTQIMDCHGADDYFLWLLCFNAKCKIVPNYEPIYIHKNTGNNYSANKTAMNKSLNNMLQMLKLTEYPKNKLHTLEKTIKFKANYKRHPLKYAIQNPVIFLYNVYYRIIWRGYLEK